MPDDATTAQPEWTRRLQSLVDESVARSTASTANFGRLQAAATAPGVDPESWASELARQGTERGPEAYRQLTQVTGRFMSESLRLIAQYLEAYLQDLVPAGQAAGIRELPDLERERPVSGRRPAAIRLRAVARHHRTSQTP